MWAIALLGFLAQGNRANVTSTLLEANICFQRCMAWFASSDAKQAARGACLSSFSAAGGNGEFLEQLNQLKFDVSHLKITTNRGAPQGAQIPLLGSARHSGCNAAGPAQICPGIAHPSCWAASAMGRAGMFFGLLQGDVWQHDLQIAMWITLLATESRAARWKGSTLGSALQLGCCCCRSPARCVPCTRSRTGAARTSGPASLSTAKRRSVPEASRQDARLPQSAGWPQRRYGGPV